MEISKDVLAFHGSPTDGLTYLLEKVDPDGVRPATEREVMDRLGDESERKLLLCGHTHIQRSMRLSTGALVLNPGSVGWPVYDDDALFPHLMESGTPHARYAIAEDSSGRWLAEI
ncbi:metallophosphoesterase [Arthrobacter sp. SO5]|uniref:metallophosphoesterase family protein n=1 Tax=Arthrobacter sp. SO5 TaxID=1897055 RepID=UPI001E355AB3|nr:metallophosphoesterase family protein [Arthrobacter sp. SO5]